MKNFLDRKKPALWITATLAAAAVVPAVILLKRSKKQVKPECQTYRVGEICYQAPFYAFTYTAETAPSFRLSEAMELSTGVAASGPIAETVWTSLGQLREFSLNESQFDHLFFTGREREIARIRRKNVKAWRLDPSEESKAPFYYLLLQRRGQLYLAHGYHTDSNDRGDSPSSIIRWLFRLEPV